MSATAVKTRPLIPTQQSVAGVVAVPLQPMVKAAVLAVVARIIFRGVIAEVRVHRAKVMQVPSVHEV
jgi:hypothetical protein